MTPRTLLSRSLRHHWRMHVALVLCAVVGSATLTGALIVGDSMRGSLRDNALRRLGPVHYAMRSPRFIRAESAKAVDGCGIVLLQGGIEHAERKSRANRVQIVGVDEQYWAMWPETGADIHAQATATSQTTTNPSDGAKGVVLNQSLAKEIGAALGDEVLLRLARQSVVPAESVLGRPDETTASLRLSVSSIVDDDSVGGFSLDPGQATPMTAFVPLAALQRSIHREGRINAIVMASMNGNRENEDIKNLNNRLAWEVSISDFELQVRDYTEHGNISLESDRLLLEPAIEAAGRRAAKVHSMPVGGVLTYLANDMELLDFRSGKRNRVPYSVVAAIDETAAQMTLGLDSSQWSAMGTDGILLNEWTLAEMGAKPGDRLRMTYYVSAGSGELVEESCEFTVREGSVAPELLASQGLLPPYRGISDAATLADWNPPSHFKIDLKRILPADEAYWKSHKGAPKAFIALAQGQRLWANRDAQHGQLTSLRFGAARAMSLKDTYAWIGGMVKGELNPGQMGLAFEDVRERATQAGGGSTDFGILFISFSFFIIASAALLVALVFRLNLERRAGEIGLLTAIGYSHKQVVRLFLTEGAALAAVGSAIGLACSAGYAWLMLAGLRTMWAQAVSSPFLTLHVTPMSLAIGFVASFLVAAFSLRLAIRGLAKHSPRSLLAGVMASNGNGATTKKRRIAPLIFKISMVIGVGLVTTAFVSDAIPQAAAFFGGGAALLVGELAATSVAMSHRGRSAIARGGPMAMARLGVRNATRQRGRSLMTTGLIASASFVIIAVGASRHGADASSLEKSGGAGGYQVILESSVPLPFDIGAPKGRESIGLSDDTSEMLASSTVMPLRLKPGDDASCLNLYQVARPRILGATNAFIDRGGFAFQKSLAKSDATKSNPWKLLNEPFDDGAIPAIGDANTLTWLLKVGLGGDFEMADEQGIMRRLRIVGMLSGSALQGELVVSEASFKSLFPSISGYGFVMVDAGARPASDVIAALERDLGRFGADAVSTLDRLNQFRAVENTYMSAFGMLGGIGLLLGSLGLAAVMLRNVLERRGELALLRALGFARSRIALMVLAENGALLVAGLLIGSSAALLAVLPHVLSKPGDMEWGSLLQLVVSLLVTGTAAAGLAVRAAVKSPLLGAMRSE